MPAPVASGWSQSPGGPCTHWKSAALSRRTWIAGLRRCLCRRPGCVGAARGAATRQPGCLEPVTQVADERCAVNLADGKSLLGAHSCTNAHLPILPDLTGLGSGPARPCALLTLSELCFTVREVFFSFGPHTHHAPVGRRVATIALRIARVRS